jgi:hypothetical protein
VGRYRFATVIEGVQYIFKVRWNTRDAAWYFDVLEFDETPIATGVKIVLGTNFAKWCNHPLFLDGVMFALSTAQPPHADATLDDLGTTIKVYYYTRADMSGNTFTQLIG